MEDVWFGIEVKVRALIKDILEPTVRRVVENRDQVDRISKTQEIFNSRLDDLDINIGKYARKIAGIDDFVKRINEFDGVLRLAEVRFNRDREEIKAEVSTFASKMIHFEEYLNVFDRLKESIRSDITNLTYSIQNVKNNTEDNFNIFKDEYRGRIQDMNSQLISFDVMMSQFEKTTKLLGKEVGENTSALQSNIHTTEELGKRTKELRKSYKHLKKSAYDSIEKLRLLAIKNMTESQMSDKRMLDMINDELPVKNRIMFTKVLYDVLNDPYQKHELAKLEKSSLESINESNLPIELKISLLELKNKAETVLATPLPEKKEYQPLLHSTELESGSHKRKNRQRTVFVVKKDNPDSETIEPRISRRDTNSKRRSIELESIQEEDEHQRQGFKRRTVKRIKPDENTLMASNMIEEAKSRKSQLISLKDYDVIKDELQIARFNSLINRNGFEEEDADDSSFNSSNSYGPPIDYHPLIDEAKSEAIALVSDLRSVHDKSIENFNSQVAEIKEEINQKFKVTMVAIESSAAEGQKNLKELELIINQALAECTSAITMRKRDQSDFSMEIKGLHQKAEGIESQYGLINERMDSINRNMDFITEALKILNVLSRQDEIDRDSIALMGYKEGAKDTKGKSITKQVVSIEKQCLSCTGQASVVLTAFKIACLAYAPSPVSFRSTNFTRKELIEVQAKILESLSRNKALQVASIIEEVQGNRSKTASNIRIRPLSVPSSNFTLQTPRADFSLDSEFPPLFKKSVNNTSRFLQP